MATKDIFESRIKFKENYEYDMKSKQLFKNGEEVQMPKNEAKLFFLLVSNIEKVVSYEVIENYVWSEKSMSNEALRMTRQKLTPTSSKTSQVWDIDLVDQTKFNFV
ncbi:hypothetical protein [Campylobacter concisus]